VGLAIARLARSCQRLQLCQRVAVSNGRSPLPDNRVASVGTVARSHTSVCRRASAIRGIVFECAAAERDHGRLRASSARTKRRALAHAERRFTVARKMAQR